MLTYQEFEKQHPFPAIKVEWDRFAEVCRKVGLQVNGNNVRTSTLSVEVAVKDGMVEFYSTTAIEGRILFRKIFGFATNSISGTGMLAPLAEKIARELGVGEDTIDLPEEVVCLPWPSWCSVEGEYGTTSTSTSLMFVSEAREALAQYMAEVEKRIK